ncbi:MAG: thioesterase family protein [Nitrospiraceae bacterium]|nr:thioesterase family protein [Nitrospiraceae bacterium]MDA8207694.1 thioesterase family protein [Actinomycetota bacterium]
MDEAAFFKQLDERSFLAEPSTVGPWAPDAQHGGPPCALIASAIEEASAAPGTELSNLSVEFLKPVPLGKLDVDVRAVRSGYKVALYEAELGNEDGPCMLARAWRTRREEGRVPEVSLAEPTGRDPAGLPSADLYHFPYIAQVDWRFEEGAFADPGPAVVHARPRIPLVQGRAMTGLEALLVMVDSANGFSQELPMDSYIYVPVSLFVSLVALPDPGGFITFDSHTRISSSGIGITETTISQAGKFVGSAMHTLYVEPRKQP